MITVLKKYTLFTLLLIPFLAQAQISFVHERKVAQLYHEQKYKQAWNLLLEIEDKGHDSPFTYKTKGYYHTNASFYYYVVRTQFYLALQNKDEIMFTGCMNDMRHLCKISSAEYPKQDATFYQDFRKVLTDRAELSNESDNRFEAEEFSHFLAQYLHDSTELYHRLYTPLYYYTGEITTEVIDSFASAKMPFKLHTLPMLHTYLTYGLKTDEQKVRAFYTWMVCHIHYDFSAYKGHSQMDKDVYDIIHTGTAICAGYAYFFNELCKLSGITSRYISGYAKGDGYDPNHPYESGHAWNMVLLNGKWELIDCTWGDPGDDFFYCTDPQLFVTTHIPRDEKDQLLASPVTMQTYVSMDAVYFKPRKR